MHVGDRGLSRGYVETLVRGDNRAKQEEMRRRKKKKCMSLSEKAIKGFCILYFSVFHHFLVPFSYLFLTALRRCHIGPLTWVLFVPFICMFPNYLSQYNCFMSKLNF